MCVQIWRLWRQRKSLDARITKDVPECRTELGVTVMDEVLTGLEPSPLVHREVASHLHHPLRVRMRHHTGNVDPSCIQFNEKEHVKRHHPAQRPHFRGEEVRGDQQVQMGADKFFPSRCLLALGSSRQATAFEDIAHVGSLMS